MKAQELRQYLDKFLVSPAAKQASARFRTPGKPHGAKMIPTWNQKGLKMKPKAKY